MKAAGKAHLSDGPYYYRTPGEAAGEPLHGAATNGVVARSVRDSAAMLDVLAGPDATVPYAPAMPAGPFLDEVGQDPGRLRIGFHTASAINPSPHPSAVTAVTEAAKLLESLGHHVEEIDAPVPEFFVADFLTYWSLLAGHICLTGRRTLDPSFDRHRVDNLTLGLAGNALRRSYRLPLAIARLAASKRVSARFFRRYDAVLTPTLGRVTPEIGWLDPGQPFETVMGRLLEWVTFTPLQNATGDPAISLPLAQTQTGLPVGMMLSATRGREALLLELAYELEEASPFARIQDREQAGDRSAWVTTGSRGGRTRGTNGPSRSSSSARAPCA
jgi:amidase